MNKAGLDDVTLQNIQERLINEIPLKKMGTAEDVAKLVSYLSDDSISSFITGTEIIVDGGMVL